jgi:hypothetical protein
LPAPVSSPDTKWWVGLDFDTSLATMPLRVKELIVDGQVDNRGAPCHPSAYRAACWDVTNPAEPLLLEESATRPTRQAHNHRITHRTNFLLQPGRHYRLVARVTELRGSPIVGPVVSGPLTIHGGLSFRDLDPCSGQDLLAAVVDPTQVYLAVRVVEDDDQIWSDLGFSTPGAEGPPVLSGSGVLQADERIILELYQAPPSSRSVLFLGTEAACLPFAGGTLLPAPEFIHMKNTDARGEWRMQSIFPPGVPAGHTIYLQAWIPDSSAPGGLAGSNALSATTPY